MSQHTAQPSDPLADLITAATEAAEQLDLRRTFTLDTAELKLIDTLRVLRDALRPYSEVVTPPDADAPGIERPDAHAVECPRCHAAAGTPCQNTPGERPRYVSTHVARINAATVARTNAAATART